MHLAETNSAITIRIPLIPGINDDEENLCASAEFIRTLPNITAVELMGYHDMAAAKYQSMGLAYQLQDIKTPGKDQLRHSVSILERSGLTVKIR
jgi:pyruvate formate lyase activating enzyme